MSYSTLASTQFVSNNNLQDGVTTSVITLNGGQTIPVNNKFINKQNLLTYVNADPTNIYLAAKTNLQIIAKRDIVANTQVDPTTATLTFSNYSMGIFYFNLSVSIPSTNVVISAAIVNGHTSTNCNLAVSSSDAIINSITPNPLTILRGELLGSVLGNTPMDSTIHSWVKINNAIVNGTTVTNGSVITIGGTTVTVVINLSCNIYS